MKALTFLHCIPLRSPTVVVVLILNYADLRDSLYALRDFSTCL